MRIDGRVQGQINGTIIGEVHGYVRGEASLFVNMGKMEQQEDDGSSLEAFIQKEKEEMIRGIPKLHSCLRGLILKRRECHAGETFTNPMPPDKFITIYSQDSPVFLHLTTPHSIEFSMTPVKYF